MNMMMMRRRRRMRMSKYSSVGIQSGYGFNEQSSIPASDMNFVSLKPCPDLLWAPFDLLSLGFRRFVSQE